MSDHVSWMLELEIEGGRESSFRELMTEMIAHVEANEPGTLDYEWSVSADGGRCHIFERYADSAAALAHLGGFGERFAGRFLEVLHPVRFVVYGSPTDAVKDAVAGFNPEFMEPAAGFSR